MQSYEREPVETGHFFCGDADTHATATATADLEPQEETAGIATTNPSNKTQAIIATKHKAHAYY